MSNIPPPLPPPPTFYSPFNIRIPFVAQAQLQVLWMSTMPRHIFAVLRVLTLIRMAKDTNDLVFEGKMPWNV